MRTNSQVGSTKKATRTRQQILAAALELFKEKGFDETTMRDVAAKANLAVGATYYYFKTKEALVLAFYLESCEEFVRRSAEIIGESSDIKYLLINVIRERLVQLHPYRSFLGTLIRNGLDPKSECSPFSEATADIRESAIKIFEQMVVKTSSKVPSNLQPHLPRLLWLYHLGIILFWTYDSSARQEKSQRLLEGTAGMIVAGLAIARLPLMSSLLKPLIRLLEDFFPSSVSTGL